MNDNYELKMYNEENKFVKYSPISIQTCLPAEVATTSSTDYQKNE